MLALRRAIPARPKPALLRLTYEGCHESFRINASDTQDLNCTFKDRRAVRAKIDLVI